MSSWPHGPPADRAPSLTPGSDPGSFELIPSRWPKLREGACLEFLDAGVGRVNERVHVTIDGDGHVLGATASGDTPAVGACLEKEVRSWTFPPTGAASSVDIPFIFVGQ